MDDLGAMMADLKGYELGELTVGMKVGKKDSLLAAEMDDESVCLGVVE